VADQVPQKRFTGTIGLAHATRVLNFPAMLSVRFRGFALLLLISAPVHAQSSVPTSGAAIPPQSLAAGAAAVTVDLRNHFTLPTVTGQIAQINTVAGRFNFELLANDAPKTVENFQAYINAGRYQNTFIHRAVSGFVIQGGGYAAVIPYAHIATFPTVVNEFKLGNTRGTVAMAKLGSDPNSASSEWFVNLADNRGNLDNQNGGFTVFARVIGNGMNVVDGIANLPRYNIGFDATGAAASTPLRNVPAGETQLKTQYYVTVTDVKIIPIFPSDGGATAVFSFSATTSNTAVVTAVVDGSTLSLTPVRAGSATVTVTATDTNGTTALQNVLVTVTGTGGSTAPEITLQPQAQVRLVAGTANTVVLSVAATGTPAPSYQWRRNGAALTGQQSPTVVLTNATEAQAGTYTCIVNNTGGTVESQAAVVSFAATNPADAGRLVNLAIRTNAGTGAQTLIVGFSLGGANTSGSPALLVRGVGPSLGQFGLAGVLADPVATMFRGEATVATNDNWGGDAAITSRATQVGAFAYASASSLDSALALSPAGGSYTVQVTGKNGGTGIALAEIYDGVAKTAFTATTPRLVNVSARTEVGAGSDILIAGFVIGGTTAKTVMIRAIGPTLAVFGVTDTLADPKLQLFADSALVAENNDWGGDAQLVRTAETVGAFALPQATSRDAVLLVTLPPGNYTAQVSGANGGTGVALVELYEVP
jgi:cyclophilin family peptidyl-prolyl cis-trans isomerase